MKTAILAMLAALIVSCSPFGFNPMGYEVLHMPLDEAWQKVAAMKYIPEPEGEEYWKSPKEFFADGGGDCEDFAIALMYLLGPESSFIGVSYDGYNHAIVKYRDLYIEPIFYGLYQTRTDLVIIHTIDFRSTMGQATYSGHKAIMNCNRLH